MSFSCLRALFLTSHSRDVDAILALQWVRESCIRMSFLILFSMILALLASLFVKVLKASFLELVEVK